jgi:hypothetical protein
LFYIYTQLVNAIEDISVELPIPHRGSVLLSLSRARVHPFAHSVADLQEDNARNEPGLRARYEGGE